MKKKRTTHVRIFEKDVKEINRFAKQSKKKTAEIIEMLVGKKKKKDSLKPLRLYSP